jgi:hypothetical protein
MALGQRSQCHSALSVQALFPEGVLDSLIASPAFITTSPGESKTPHRILTVIDAPAQTLDRVSYRYECWAKGDTIGNGIMHHRNIHPGSLSQMY